MIQRLVPLKMQAYELILEALTKNEIKSEEVYSAQWFADKYGISRTPVREALLQLREEGMIETRLNQGIVVKPISLEDAREVFQVRTAIEGFCTENLASEVKKGNAQALEAVKKVEVLLGNEEADFGDQDLQFHCEIIRFTGNLRFLQLIAQIRNRMNVYWSASRGIPERVDKAKKEHLQIFEAVKNGDKVRAYRCSTDHLHNIYEDIRGYLTLRIEE